MVHGIQVTRSDEVNNFKLQNNENKYSHDILST